MTAVLDWDLASLGPREMDLGWHLGLEFMMEALFGGRLPGFPGPGEAVARYEDRSGYEVRDLGWHEVFALVRALAINDRHQRITGDSAPAPEPDGGHPAGAPGGGRRRRTAEARAEPAAVEPARSAGRSVVRAARTP